MKKVTHYVKNFVIPLCVLAGVLLYALLAQMGLDVVALIIILTATVVGSYGMFAETIHGLMQKQFALDYIAIVAICVSLFTGNFLIAGVIAFMLSTGRTLEEYGTKQAKASLTSLANRIPNDVLTVKDGHVGTSAKIYDIKVGQEIYIRKGEVIPLDGELVSETALTDESSLTGEPYLMDKMRGDQIRSGTVNIGEAFTIRVTKEEKDSAYRKIIEMVKAAQKEKAPLVRLADKYSTFFTLITFAIIGAVYFFTRDVSRVLAVLVIATPCPLILATPIALMGGMNASAKRRIIVKKLSSLEVLSRINAMVFDKTGTITLGRPSLTRVELVGTTKNEKAVLEIAEAIERSSLHPFAKAIVAYAKEHNASSLHADHIKEEIGVGISGTVEGKRYVVRKLSETEGMGVEMQEEGTRIAIFHFADIIKKDSKDIINELKKDKIELYIFTGDKKAAADKIASTLDQGIIVKAECTPEDKKTGIEKLKQSGKTTVMIGDGINDAPALALADVGIVFSNEEQTAASEAADIVLLGGDFALVLESITIARRTIRIALQSILWGIGLSLIGMTAAAFGFIPAIVGAFLQEAIDVVVILNALRASR